MMEHIGIALLPQQELIDLIESVSPNLTPEHTELLAKQLRPALEPLNTAFAIVDNHPVLQEAFGELLCRIGAGMEGIA
ncbi:hypothetical protein RI537_23595 [Aeromonas salmonicida]|uniref:hypothetical protein n=1 Tax=Aeromonas salmonicida TaxID=645 RepID=UPI00342B2FFE